MDPETIKALDAGRGSIPLEGTTIGGAGAEPDAGGGSRSAPAGPTDTGGSGPGGARSIESRASVQRGDPQQLPPVNIDAPGGRSSWIAIAVIVLIVVGVFFYVRARRRG